MKLIPIILLSLLIVPSLALADPTSDTQTFFPDFGGDQYGYVENFANQETQMIWGIDFISAAITYVKYLTTETYLLLNNYMIQGIALLFIIIGLFLILSSAFTIKDDHYGDSW